ncbi:MAG: hypothetical protein V3U84_06210 [Thiotrichaceae bacterium]
MKKLHLISVACVCVLTFVTNISHAAFVGRLPATPGGTDYQAYYDDQLDITWTADANINGLENWTTQVAWAADLTVDGVGGWRLPSVDVNGDGLIINCLSSTQVLCKDTEYGHLFHYGAGTTLGSGVTRANPGPFSNLHSAGYWSGTAFQDPTAGAAWVHVFFSGVQNAPSTGTNNYAWAVYDGDVSVVPIPAAAWLFGSGLLGLIGIGKRKV